MVEPDAGRRRQVGAVRGDMLAVHAIIRIYARDAVARRPSKRDGRPTL
jgi:hypothetical protein